MARKIKAVIVLFIILAVIFFAIWIFCIRSTVLPVSLLTKAGDLFLENGKPNTAATMYKTAFRINGTDDDLAVKAADAYYAVGNLTKSEYYLNKAIELRPAEIQHYIQLSKLFIEQDKLLDAEMLLNNCEDKDAFRSLESLRPCEPVISPGSGKYYDNITCSIAYSGGYVLYSLTDEFPSVLNGSDISGLEFSAGNSKICAIVVGDNGLVSKHSSAEYTVFGEISEITFENAQIDNQIRTQLGKSRYDILFTSDLWNINTLQIPENVTDISFISNFINLQELSIAFSDFDYSPIRSLKNLRKLSVSGGILTSEDCAIIGGLAQLEELYLPACGLSDVDFIALLHNLTVLDISDNSITDILALSALDGIEKFNISGNQISDISSISTMRSLTELNLSYNSIDNLAALSSSSMLLKLSASDCGISSIKPIENNRNLTYLDLRNNNIFSIDPIKNFSEMEYLYVSGNKISSLSAVTRFSRLLELDAADNRISECPTFTSDCALVLVNLDNNNLDDIDGLSKLYSLTYLSISDNRIHELRSISTLPSLVKVEAYNNPLEDVTPLTDRDILVFYTPGYLLDEEQISEVSD